MQKRDAGKSGKEYCVQSKENKETGIPGADESIRAKSDPFCTSE